MGGCGFHINSLSLRCAQTVCSHYNVQVVIVVAAEVPVPCFSRHSVINNRFTFAQVKRKKEGNRLLYPFVPR